MFVQSGRNGIGSKLYKAENLVLSRNEATGAERHHARYCLDPCGGLKLSLCRHEWQGSRNTSKSYRATERNGTLEASAEVVVCKRCIDCVLASRQAGLHEVWLLQREVGLLNLQRQVKEKLRHFRPAASPRFLKTYLRLAFRLGGQKKRKRPTLFLSPAGWSIPLRKPSQLTEGRSWVKGGIHKMRLK